MGKRETPEIFPGAWRGLSPDLAAEVALKPLRSLALALGVESKESLQGPDLSDVGVVLQALVERAEVILGIPDQSL